MEFNELIIADRNTLSNAQRDFLSLHNSIIYSGNNVCRSLIDMSELLKRMRDTKLYLEAGFETFGEYSENAVGIKERQAYNYINVIENLPEDFLHSNAKIGISKLALLSKLPEDKFLEIAEEDFENISVSELKDRINELEGKLKTAEDKVKHSEIVVNSFNQSQENKIKAALDLAEIKHKDEITDIKRSSENKLNEVIGNYSKEVNDLKSQIVDLKGELSSAKSIVKVQDTPMTLEKLANAEAELAKAKEEIDQLSKRTFIASDDLVVFKSKFEDFQRLGADLIKLLSGFDKTLKDKLTNAMIAVFRGWFN